MGNSTITLQNVVDYVVAKGIPNPTQVTGSYGPALALELACDVMADLVAERFNWKWNRVTAAPFYTNSFQQDYPQLGITNLGWLEDCDRVDINNTAIPKPLKGITCRRQLSRASTPWTPVSEICWMYNSQLSYGIWPGPGVTYSPLLAALVVQNPLMSMIDQNGNLLIVTGFGTTGSVAPLAAANAAEGVTVTDGTVTWTVVAEESQGFRVNPLPGAAGPVWKMIPYYQKQAVRFLTLQTTLDPIPNDYSQYFKRGFEAYCLQASPNPGDRARFEDAHMAWLKSMDDVKKQGDREADAYALLPVSQPVENVYGWQRNPQDPSQPY
jgi:hypothetical protein